MKELDIQGQLVKSCKNQGGYGFKTDHKHIAGLPDLFLALPDVGNAFIEIKLLTGNSDIVLLSPIQSATILRMRTAGVGACTCAVRAAHGRLGNYDLFVATDGSTKINSNYVKIYKAYGEDWPIADILRHCAT